MKHLKLFFALFAMLALGVGNAWGETVTLNNLGAGLTSTSNTSVSTTKVGDYTLNYLQGKKQGNSILLAKGTNGGTSFISNKTPIPGAIQSVTVYINTGAAGKTTYHCAFSTTECTSKYTTGSTAVNITGGNSNKYTCSVANASYFCISLGNNNNGQVLKLEIEYTPASSGGSGETAASVPTFSVPEGTFYSPINVELSCETADAEIYYTLDGSTPSSTSEKYTTAIAISETTTVKAIAVKDGLTDSEVATATYIKGETVTSYDIDFETNALEAYVNWDFSNITIAKTITAKGGTYYGNTSGKASASIKTKEQIQYPGTLTFSVSKESTNTTASNWLVQVSENGSTWTDVKTLSATEMSKGVWKDHSVDLSGYENVYVQISYGSSTAVRAIDEISLAQGVAPVKYTLTIESPENGTLLVTNGGASVASGDQFKAGTSLVVTPAPATGYVFESLTVDGSAVELKDGTYTFNMPAANVTIAATFKESAKPDATLTLSKNDVAETFPGSWKQDDKVTLPSIKSDCVKEFVGWSADPNCATDPEYKAGDEYTLAATTQTLYAVYATVQGGGEVTSEDLFENNGTYNSTAGTITWELANVVSILQEKSNASSPVADYVKDPRWYKDHLITITPSANIKEIVVKAQSNDYATALASSTYTNATATANGDVVTITPTDGNEKITIKMGAQARLSTLTVTYAATATYSDYSTACAAALDKPTFSVAEGTYTEAKSIELSATEGDIYYTLDGTEPTESSTQYTTAINLDECGTTTIKAIAISTDSESPVASATYTINLPITNTAATAYTPEEAIAIIDGACDKSEEVYVKGVVVSTSEFNATYGNYDVIVKAVDDNSATPTTFTFYRMYKAAGKTKFTASDEVIGVGDIITAKGVLKKHNSTYELAEGCYMVERVAFTEPKTDISNTFETAYTVDKAFELISDVKSDLDKEVYVKGLVAVASEELYNEKYLTYSISDNGQTTGNVLKVYDGLNIDGVAFTSKDDVKVGDYVVVKGKLYNYGGTYEINKDNQLVQHIKAATITIADITMEVGETKTIAATITPDAAKTEVAYSIKAGSDDCITLSDNNITAIAEGTATIVATIATDAEGDYMGKTVEFKVTVTPKSTKDNVVILAELGGKWYAMKGAVPTGKANQLDALEVTYFNGTLYNVAESDKASITWTRSIVDGKATFVNNGKYLKGGTSTDLTLVGTVDNNCKWMWNDENGYYTTNTSGTIRTFLYRENYNFKNYGANQAGKEDANGNYSELPVVTAPVYATGDIVYTRTVTNGNYGTICLPYASSSHTGAEFYEVSWLKEGTGLYLDQLEAGAQLEAGKPYIFRATSTEIKVTCTGAAVAEPEAGVNGLTGTFTDIAAGGVQGNYIIAQNQIWVANDQNTLPAYRAYINKDDVPTTEQAKLPGRRRVCMGENAATGLDNITTGENTTIKVIENGQLIIIRNGEKFNAQGVRF